MSEIKYPIYDKLTQYKKEDVVWLPMRQLSTRDQMTQKLTTLGHSVYGLRFTLDTLDCK